jgi:hypothetical protein
MPSILASIHFCQRLDQRAGILAAAAVAAAASGQRLPKRETGVLIVKHSIAADGSTHMDRIGNPQ